MVAGFRTVRREGRTPVVAPLPVPVAWPTVERHEGTIRWGIAATGGIAGRFAEAFGHLADAGEDCALVAVGSRAQGTADGFAARHGIGRAHGSYADLAADPDVDVVYVASLQPGHMDDTVRFLEAGKHVLVEKPMALNATEVDTMVAAAEANDRFLMEAMWMRFNPAHAALVDAIRAGRIGEVRRVNADFSIGVPFDPDHRLWNPGKGGGALLDLGVYPVTLAWWVLGEPDSVAAVGRVAPTGVDEQTTLLCGWDGGVAATLTCGIGAGGTMTARIDGTEGYVEIPAPFHASDRATIHARGERVEIEEAPASLHHQVFEVHRCLRAGERESPRMPLATSRALLARLDGVRAGLGVRYPSE